MRLINADELWESIYFSKKENDVYDTTTITMKELYDIIDNAPTVAVDEEIERQREEIERQREEMNNECFTEQEKIVLRLMFKNFSNILESCDGYICIDDMGFMSSDLYSLFLKIGIGDFWH